VEGKGITLLLSTLVNDTLLPLLSSIWHEYNTTTIDHVHWVVRLFSHTPCFLEDILLS
jgi:hypothetical protein